MDRSAPLNIDPVSIAATFHPSQNVTANPTSLHQMDMLDEDFLRPTTIWFAETDTGNNFSNFQHNSIQRPSPQLPLNPLFGSNPKTPYLNTPVTNPVTHMGRRLYGLMCCTYPSFSDSNNNSCVQGFTCSKRSNKLSAL